MKIRYGKRIMALMLALALCLAGCGKAGNTAGAGDNAAGAGENAAGGSGTAGAGSAVGGGEVGRYTEELRSLPGELSRMAGPVRLEDGSLLLVDYSEGPFVSEDDGISWTKQYEDWIGTMGEGYYMNCAIAPDGSLFVVWQPIQGEEGTVEEGTETEAAFEMPDIRYVLLSPDGEKRELSLPFDTAAYEYLENCWFAPDGRLIVSEGKGVYEVDRETGETTLLFETESRIEGACFSGTAMLALGRTEAWWYDLDSGEPPQKDDTLSAYLSGLTGGGETALFFTGGNYLCLAALDEKQQVWLAGDEGLYRYERDGEMEQLLAGTACSLGDPSVAVYGMLAEAGECLILFRTGLGRIYFDQELASGWEKELVVYSLEKSRVLRQAVSIYQKSHPEVRVRYEIGMSAADGQDETAGGDGQTAEDAIKTLNTAIMAGEGPDVLLLDGLPLDSWLKKGMLADLDPVYQEISIGENYFDNIAEAFRSGEGLYVIPANFRIPLIFGEDGLLKGMTGLADLADAAEKERERKPEGTILDAYVPQVLLALLAPSSAPAWTKEQGTLDEEAVEDFLIQAQRIWEAEDSGISEDRREEYLSTNKGKGDTLQAFLDAATDISWNVMDAAYDEVPIVLGKSASVNLDFTNVISVQRLRAGLLYAMAPGQTCGAFVAENLVGIPAKSREPELAQEFVKTLLSADVLSRIQETYPVNRESFDNLLDGGEMEEGGEAFGSMGLMKDDGSVLSLDIYWPDEGEKECLKDMVESLDTPYLPGTRVEEEVLAAAEKMLNGEYGIEEAMAQIKEKVRLYLAETS